MECLLKEEGQPGIVLAFLGGVPDVPGLLADSQIIGEESGKCEMYHWHHECLERNKFIRETDRCGTSSDECMVRFDGPLNSIPHIKPVHPRVLVNRLATLHATLLASNSLPLTTPPVPLSISSAFNEAPPKD